jgi:uncharacterized protein (DUF2062 family)
MEPAARICVVLPVYNHGLTVQQVVQGARAAFPVIVVDDGSTDSTPTVLAGETGITLVTLPGNRGKGAALRAGLAKAEALGFTHAITIDADGQHSTGALAEFAAAAQRRPEALILGTRDLKQAGAPWARRATNALSNFWVRFETGLRLSDTQCGYRCYPLAAIRSLRVKSERYAFELEIQVKAAWAGIPLVPQQVWADYAAPTSRLSHFRPGRDFAEAFLLHCRLATQAFCLPAPLRRLLALGAWGHLPRSHRVRTVFRHLFAEHTESPGRVACAVGIGLFCGIAPIWGFQMVAAAVLAHRLRLNKAIALTASNISFPLAAPFILAAGLILGHFLWTGRLVEFSPDAAARQIPVYFCEWLAGSVVLAILVAVLGALVTFLLASLRAGGRPEVRHE